MICAKGKENRSPFKEVGKRAENVLPDLIHTTDVMGPINVSSFSGSRYILTFVDDCSHKVFAVAIKPKNLKFWVSLENSKNLLKNNVDVKLKYCVPTMVLNM